MRSSFTFLPSSIPRNQAMSITDEIFSPACEVLNRTVLKLYFIGSRIQSQTPIAELPFRNSKPSYPVLLTKSRDFLTNISTIQSFFPISYRVRVPTVDIFFLTRLGWPYVFVSSVVISEESWCCFQDSQGSLMFNTVDMKKSLNSIFANDYEMDVRLKSWCSL